MKYAPSHIANFMLDKADEEGRPISPMKLLKLVYLGYGWSLAVLGEKLFEEPILAWAHGPVVRSLYDEFKHLGKDAIDCRSVDYDLESDKFIQPRIKSDDKDVHVILGKVWGIYKHFGAWDLRNITHEDGSPWSQVYRDGVRNAVIPDELIKSYFQQKIRQYVDNAK